METLLILQRLIYTKDLYIKTASNQMEFPVIWLMDWELDVNYDPGTRFYSYVFYY